MAPGSVSLTVDLVVLTVRQARLQALVVRRGVSPFKGRLALPGGFVADDEAIEHAAARELAEETSVTLDQVHLEQLRTYGDPGRDPRGRVVTVAHLVMAPDLPVPTAGTDAAEAEWRPVDELVRSKLAFDHDEILRDAVERARAKLEYTNLGTAFCPPEFTIAELRRVYEIVWGVDLDPRNFHRKVSSTSGLLEATGSSTTRDGGRPAQLYRPGPTTSLYPPILRP
jgi:8-oxo-dGTP diphosphatase